MTPHCTTGPQHCDGCLQQTAREIALRMEYSVSEVWAQPMAYYMTYVGNSFERGVELQAELLTLCRENEAMIAAVTPVDAYHGAEPYGRVHYAENGSTCGPQTLPSTDMRVDALAMQANAYQPAHEDFVSREPLVGPLASVGDAHDFFAHPLRMIARLAKSVFGRAA